jgi:hypothetical protein
MIRVVLPAHLRTLAGVDREVKVHVEGRVTQRSVLDAVEACYPMLRGTIRDHATQQRRPFLRFFACELDLSHEPPDAPLPEAVAAGEEPFLVVGAMAGGLGAGPDVGPIRRGLGMLVKILVALAVVVVGFVVVVAAAVRAAPHADGHHRGAGGVRAGERLPPVGGVVPVGEDRSGRSVKGA